MIAELITTGPAFTDGPGAQAQMIYNALALLGIELRYQAQTGGQRDRLQQAMAQALQRSDCILVVGGVGLRPEDNAKEIICEGLSIPCDPHGESYERLRSYYEAAGLPVPPEAGRACMLPRGGAVLAGKGAGAPGCAVAAGDQCILLLPAPAEEGLPMFMEDACAFLAAFSGATVVSRVARVFGLTQEQTLSHLQDIMAARNPILSIYGQHSEVVVRVTARAGTRAQASNMCTPYLKEIVGRLGESVYGIDVESLEAVAITHIGQKQQRLSSAESGTGGLLARRLNAVPGAQSVYPLGLAAHADRVKVRSLGVPEKLIKKLGAVSDRVAIQMAAGAMEAGGTEIGLAVTGVSGGPSADGQPNGLFYVAACDENQAVVRRLSLPPEMDTNAMREAAVSHALNLVRLILDYDPDPCPGAVPLAAALKGKAELCPPPESLEDALGETGRHARRKKAKEVPAGGRSRRSGWGRARLVLLALFVLTFLGSAAYLGNYYWKSHQSRTLYDSLASIAEKGVSSESKTDSPDLPKGYPSGYLPRFADLWEQNPDIRGWLKIEDTPVDYPVVQAKDNEYYLRRDFERKSNDHGVPFLDYEAELNPASANLIIYGHNMKDGQIFGELMNYKDPEYLADHPVIEFDSVYREGKYKIIGVFLASTEKDHGPVFEYEKFVNGGEEVTESFLEQVRLRTMVDTGVDVTPQDELLCLSTCSYEYWEARFVVVARRVRDGESEKVDTSGISKNKSPLMPDVYYEVVKKDKPEKYEGLGAWSPDDVAPTKPAGPVGPIGPSVGGNKPADSEEEPSDEESSSSEASSSQAPASSAAPSSSTAPASSAAPSSSTPPASSAPSASQVTSSASSAASSSSKVQVSSSSSASSSESSSRITVNLRPSSAASSSKAESSSKTGSSGGLKPGESVNLFNSSRGSSSGKDEDDEAKPDKDFVDDEDPDNSSSKSDPGEKITVNANGKSYTAPFQEVVARMVQAEMGSSFHEEALKAQAVASATYLDYYLSRGQTPSIVTATGSVKSKVQKAVDAVSGERVLYDGKPINATYFASAAGCTNNAEDVWTSSLRYLTSVESPEDMEKQTLNLSYREMRNLLEDELDISRSKLEDIDPSDWLDITYCDNGEYVESVRFCDKRTKTGTWVRSNLLTKLNSHAFSVRYDDDEEEFTITCYGRGHGVGMSQMGAQYMAEEEDADYEDILEHYYTGTRVR